MPDHHDDYDEGADYRLPTLIRAWPIHDGAHPDGHEPSLIVVTDHRRRCVRRIEVPPARLDETLGIFVRELVNGRPRGRAYELHIIVST